MEKIHKQIQKAIDDVDNASFKLYELIKKYDLRGCITWKVGAIKDER